MVALTPYVIMFALPVIFGIVTLIGKILKGVALKLLKSRLGGSDPGTPGTPGTPGSPGLPSKPSAIKLVRGGSSLGSSLGDDSSHGSRPELTSRPSRSSKWTPFASDKTTFGSSKWDKLFSFLPIALLVIFTFLPSVARTIFSSWVCVPYDNYEGAAPDGEPEVVAYLWSDPRIVCGSDAHTELKSVALVFVMMWPVGMMGLFVFVLVYNRRELRSGKAVSGFAKAVRCLTGGYDYYDHTYYMATMSARLYLLRLSFHDYNYRYKNEYYWWEVIEVTRRLAVCGWVVLIQPKYIFYRLIFCIGISILCLVATAVALPCKRPEDNFLSIFAQTTLLFSFGACTLVKILTAADVTDEQLDTLIGFHTPQVSLSLSLNLSLRLSISLSLSLSLSRNPVRARSSCYASSHSPFASCCSSSTSRLSTRSSKIS